MFQERFNVVRHDICPLPAHVYETTYYCPCTPDAAHCLGYARAYFVVISLRNAAMYSRRQDEGMEGRELREH